MNQAIVRLQAIDASNWRIVASLLTEGRTDLFCGTGADFFASACLARRQRVPVPMIYAGETAAGAILLEDFDAEPCRYHLHELLIDEKCQRKSFGIQAVTLLLFRLKSERKYPRVEAAVHEENRCAIRLFEKAGFRMTSYIDAATPWNRSMVYDF